MLKTERTSVMNMENAIRGARNPMNSWGRMDSGYDENGNFILGDNDMSLAKRLARAGSDHRKFLRQIFVSVDITAPLYWWKEFDTYKVGTVANSCSTMHNIADKEFTLDDFSRDHLYAEDDIAGMYYSTTAEEEFTSTDVLKVIIEALSNYRKMYIATKDKKDWWQMIQLLPSSYNQRRTVMLNYEVLANIYKSRRNHKLDEWVDFCAEIERLQHSELITKKEDDQK